MIVVIIVVVLVTDREIEGWRAVSLGTGSLDRMPEVESEEGPKTGTAATDVEVSPKAFVTLNGGSKTAAEDMGVTGADAGIGRTAELLSISAGNAASSPFKMAVGAGVVERGVLGATTVAAACVAYVDEAASAGGSSSTGVSEPLAACVPSRAAPWSTELSALCPCSLP
jgi:hypothetical protein